MVMYLIWMLLPIKGYQGNASVVSPSHVLHGTNAVVQGNSNEPEYVDLDGIIADRGDRVTGSSECL